MSATAPQRSTGEIVRDIATDTGTLVRKEVELARAEIVAGVMSKLRMAGAFGVAAFFAVFVVVFGALAAVAGLDNVWPLWLACLVVAGGFGVLAGLAVLIAMVRTKPIALEETKRTVEEDVRWAKRQLKR